MSPLNDRVGFFNVNLYNIFVTMGAVVSFFSNEDIEHKDKTIKKIKKPAFYKGKDGPDFVLLDYNKAYETRKYNKMLLISTLLRLEDGHNFEDCAKIASKKLKAYLQGMNTSKINMGVTCPLICKGTLTNGNELIFSMVLPEDHCENAPAAMLQDLFLEEQPAKMIYVAPLKGGRSEADIALVIDAMVNRLNFEAEIFDENVYFRAMYGGNVRDKRGYCEVWLSGVNAEEEYICLRNDEESDDGH